MTITLSYRPSAQRRSFRTTLKKHGKKRKSTESPHLRSTETLHGGEIDAPQVLPKTLATLERLGLQRFPTPPFSEHLDLWQRNLRFVLSEFEAAYSRTPDEIYRREIARILTNLQSSLESVVSKERAESDLIGELRRRTSQSREQLQSLEKEYKAAVKKLAGEREQARRERDWLGLEIIRLSRIKAGFVSRILGRRKLEERAEKMQTIRLRDEQVAKRQEEIDALLAGKKAEYELAKTELSQHVNERTEDLESALNSSQAADALDIRSAACRDIAHQIASLVERQNIAQPPTLSPNDEVGG